MVCNLKNLVVDVFMNCYGTTVITVIYTSNNIYDFTYFTTVSAQKNHECSNTDGFQQQSSVASHVVARPRFPPLSSPCSTWLPSKPQYTARPTVTAAWDRQQLQPGPVVLQPKRKRTGLITDAMRSTWIWLAHQGTATTWDVARSWQMCWDIAETKHCSLPRVVPMTDPNGAGFSMLTWLGYIDGIHGTPYIAAPLGSVMGYNLSHGNLGISQLLRNPNNDGVSACIWTTQAIGFESEVFHIPHVDFSDFPQIFPAHGPWMQWKRMEDGTNRKRSGQAQGLKGHSWSASDDLDLETKAELVMLVDLWFRPIPSTSARHQDKFLR